MIGGRRSHNDRVFSPIVSLSESDVLSVYRFFDSWRGAAGYLQPEKTLMFAVLLDAVECFQKYPFARRNKITSHIDDTADWIFQNDHEWPFSFINICEAVGIDPQYLRKRLSRWQQRAIGDQYPPRQIVVNQQKNTCRADQDLSISDTAFFMRQDR
jgi:hypothetical protein